MGRTTYAVSLPANSHRYPPIADFGLIGDCQTAALVSRTGSIDWCCLPRFDAGSAFGRLLDFDHGGHCSILPVGRAKWRYSRQYLDGTLVLATTLQGPGGEARLLDCFVRTPAEPDGEPRLVRVLEGVRGSVKVEIRVAPRFDYGEVRPWIRMRGPHLHSAIGGNDGLVIWCEEQLAEDPQHELVGRAEVGAGDRLRLLLQYRRPELIDAEPQHEPDPEQIDAWVEQTAAWWRRWSGQLRLRSRDEPSAVRSAIVLKALTYEPTGGVVAAPTMALPEAIGSERNWDYRYAWVRDSSFSSRAFAELGATREADRFRAFIMRSAAGHAEDLQVCYGVGGERRIGAAELGSVEGYRRSTPVQVGNQASGQRQLDAYGEIVNLIWRWHRRGDSPDDDQWRFLVSLIDQAAERWREPDQGIWEWPGKPDHFVHSKVLCWSALDRGLRLAEECMRQAPTRRWKRARDRLRKEIESRGYDSRRGVFVQAFDRKMLDAALLLLPTVEFVAWDDERMVRTVEAIRHDLGAGDGLLYRYRRKDGLKGEEGAFLCCSFWLVECLARMGQLEEARAVFDRTLARSNDLGLFSEEIDPSSTELLGNFPQGLTHMAHIDAAVALSEVENG
jgi:GH15 family glucan-1,4-alpha-glucosidase